jgi:pyruvate/2-oxoglutarate/acetoin dehydrogenase E1 component
MYRASKGEVPDGDYTLPIGKAKVVREGKQLTVLCYGAMVHVVNEAVEMAVQEGLDPEVLDLMTLSPLDEEAVLESARKTGRVVIVHEAPKTCGYGAAHVTRGAHRPRRGLRHALPLHARERVPAHAGTGAHPAPRDRALLEEVDDGVRVQAARHW